MLAKLRAVPWWTLVLLAVAARLVCAPAWTGVAALGVVAAHSAWRNWLEHRDHQRDVGEAKRLQQLEQEVRALNQALTFKSLGK